MYHNLKRPPRLQVGDWGPSLTKQDQAKGCDINVIMERYKKTGMAPVSARTPIYGDYSAFTDFRGVMDSVVQGRQWFEALPQDVRNQFEGFEDFVEYAGTMDPDELARMVAVNQPPVPSEAPQEAKEGAGEASA